MSLPETQTRFGERELLIMNQKNNHVQSMVVYHLSTAVEAIFGHIHSTCAWWCICRHIRSPETKNVFVRNLFINFQKDRPLKDVTRLNNNSKSKLKPIIILSKFDEYEKYCNDDLLDKRRAALNKKKSRKSTKFIRST